MYTILFVLCYLETLQRGAKAEPWPWSSTERGLKKSSYKASMYVFLNCYCLRRLHLCFSLNAINNEHNNGIKLNVYMSNSRSNYYFVGRHYCLYINLIHLYVRVYKIYPRSLIHDCDTITESFLCLCWFQLLLRHKGGWLPFGYGFDVSVSLFVGKENNEHTSRNAGTKV